MRKMWREDLDPIQRELRRPTLQYKPFEFMKLVKAPPPPAGATTAAPGVHR